MTNTVMKGLTIVVSIFLTIVGIYMLILLSEIAVKYQSTSTRVFFGFIIIVIVGFVILLFLPNSTRSSTWNSYYF